MADTCAVVVSSQWNAGVVPSALKSPNGLFYLGPYQGPDSMGQAYAVYKTAPTIINGWTAPTGAANWTKTADAPFDSTSVVFYGDQDEWMNQDINRPNTVVQNAITSDTQKLYYGNTYCMPDPGNVDSVALQVTFPDLTTVSVQRAQGMPSWYVADSSCDEFNKAKKHLGGMTDASCVRMTTVQYGAYLVTGQTWQ